MALFQVRCPEEVDVFTVPHIRMKQLVCEVSEKLTTTNFQDKVSLHGLLSCIDSIFHELKRHEEIENKCIMGQLQRRLTNEQISAIVSDVHKDSHVLEILSLVKKGIKSSAKRRFLNWTNFKERLTKAMTEFQKDFLPHMKHEEEVFQPLLMEYFTFEELKEIKAKVLDLHSMFKEQEKQQLSYSAKDNKYSDSSSDSEDNESLLTTALRTKPKNKSQLCDKDTFTGIDSKDTELLPNFRAKRTKIKVEEPQPLILDFPSELFVKIFSLLGPRDLCRSAQVCRLWSYLAKDGLLWRELYPVRWIFKSYWRFGQDDDEICGCDYGEGEDLVSSSLRSSFADADADLDGCEGSEDDEHNDQEMVRKTHQLLGLVRYLLPTVGSSVWTLKLGCCPVLSNGLAFKIFSHCPNVRYLDLSQTAVSDLGFNGLFRKGGGCHLEHLDVSGCKNITDKTLVKLSSALVKKTGGISDIEDSGCECLSKCGCTKRNKEYLLPQKGLVYLGLSGCYQITDTGLRALAKYGVVSKLEHLDLSGCLSVTADGLLDLVSVCPHLDHSQFYYCDNIDEGPYADTASGCQNLECKNRVCCRTGE